MLEGSRGFWGTSLTCNWKDSDKNKNKHPRNANFVKKTCLAALIDFHLMQPTIAVLSMRFVRV